jgi:hypothetical protein
MEEVGPDVYIKNIATEALDRVVERQNVHTFSMCDIKALMNIDEVPKLYAKVVTRNLVDLYATFLNVIRALADQYSISPLRPAETIRETQKDSRDNSMTNRTMIGYPRKS